MKRGFTLVELSIVLVIIGLLIGGILVAQSMISTAKIQAQVRQIGQFDAAVNNFKTKFNGLPGDWPGINGMTHSYTFGYGDNNGLIESYSNTAACASLFYAGEMGNFWHDLSVSGLTSENGAVYLGTGNSDSGALFVTSGPNTNIPTAKAGKNGVIVPTCLVDFAGTMGNFYLIVSLREGANGGTFLSNMDPAFNCT